MGNLGCQPKKSSQQKVGPAPACSLASAWDSRYVGSKSHRGKYWNAATSAVRTFSGAGAEVPNFTKIPSISWIDGSLYSKDCQEPTETGLQSYIIDWWWFLNQSLRPFSGRVWDSLCLQALAWSDGFQPVLWDKIQLVWGQKALDKTHGHPTPGNNANYLSKGYQDKIQRLETTQSVISKNMSKIESLGPRCKYQK